MANIPPPDNLIPDWLANRLCAAGGKLPEASSLYGPITALLTWHFPVAQQFMIKPQGRVRPEHIADVEGGDVEMARVSLDSYHTASTFSFPIFCIITEVRDLTRPNVKASPQSREA